MPTHLSILDPVFFLITFSVLVEQVMLFSSLLRAWTRAPIFQTLLTMSSSVLKIQGVSDNVTIQSCDWFVDVSSHLNNVVWSSGAR